MNKEIYVKEMPKRCGECPYSELNYAYDDEVRTCKFQFGYIALYNDKFPNCPLKSLHEYKKELVAKVLGMVRENLKEELLLTKNENQEEAKLKLVKTYSIDLDVLNKIEKEILNGYTKI